MNIPLPSIGAKAINYPHFPSRQQEFIFRSHEFATPLQMAKLLKTDEKTVLEAMDAMGIKPGEYCAQMMAKSYITLIKQLWHVLNYDQLLEFLGMTSDELAITLREEDFLDVKLKAKPDCEPLFWEELSPEQIKATKLIKEAMADVSLSGKAPFDFEYNVTPLQFSGKASFDLRILYFFSGLFQHAFDVDSEEYLPDSMLQAYQSIGINGLWTQGILYQLCPFPFEPKLSEGWEKRMENLKKLVGRMKKYGIKLYLYLNEPRSMPAAFYEKYPHLRGHEVQKEKICLCTSAPDVQKYLTDSVELICREVPDIGGFFSITRSENPSNCYSHSNPETCTCPRCSKRPLPEVIGEYFSLLRRGADRVSSDIKVIAWSWAWNTHNLDIIRALPQNVILLSQSELDVPYTIGGVSGNVLDYSISILGPGERALKEWEVAKECGLELGAKVQINTSWECSTVPAIPVYDLIEEHIKRLRDLNIKNLLLSWTLGGFPSRNVMRIAQYFHEGLDNPEAISLTPTEKKASALFCEAFKNFPFSCSVLYSGPQNGGPSNLLYAEPSGYKATMTCFAYDDLNSWRSRYPVPVFYDQFSKICDIWKRGLELIQNDSGEMATMAKAAYLVFSSCRDQIAFYVAREKNDTASMAELAKKEEQTARAMLKLMNENASIGFEAANQYYYSRSVLAEKIINCRYISSLF